MHQPTHPHAATAVFLARIARPSRALINNELRITGTPRRLYTLARVLRAAQIMEQMAEIDRVNAAHPAVVAQAA